MPRWRSPCHRGFFIVRHTSHWRWRFAWRQADHAGCCAQQSATSDRESAVGPVPQPLNTGFQSADAAALPSGLAEDMPARTKKNAESGNSRRSASSNVVQAWFNLACPLFSLSGNPVSPSRMPRQRSPRCRGFLLSAARNEFVHWPPHDHSAKKFYRLRNSFEPVSSNIVQAEFCLACPLFSLSGNPVSPKAGCPDSIPPAVGAFYCPTLEPAVARAIPMAVRQKLLPGAELCRVGVVQHSAGR